MATVYDSYTGDSACNIYNGVGSNAVDYPSYDIINVFGPIYTPRIYGRDLSALEIASAGSVTIALNDAHALDLWNAANTTYVTSLSNNSLKFVAGVGSNATFALSTSNFDVTTFSQSNVWSKAQKDVSFSASNDITGLALSNVTFEAKNNSVLFKAHNNAVSLRLDDATDSIIGLASNAVNLTATSNVSIESLNAEVFVAASNQTCPYG